MKPWTAISLAALGTLLLLGGCSSKKVVPFQALTTPHAHCLLGSQKMGQTITDAARISGWSAESGGRGSLQAIRSDKKRMAKVAISYTPWRYHISYLDSDGMSYNGDTIDERYALWVRNLQQNIDRTLAAACEEARSSVKATLDDEETELPVMIETVPKSLQNIR